MADTIRPDDEAHLADLVQWAADGARALELVGQGTKRALGRPVDADAVVDMGALSGIVDYTPAELVLTARAATPLSEIRAALDAAGQHLAFEPIDYHGLLGLDDARPGTIGGLVACNLAGPRRIAVGAARDHLLGVKGVGGNGVPFTAGGKVVKNVTGFDITKLMAGSWGTLAALTEVTLKVLPKPEQTRTVLLLGLDDTKAVEAMAQALCSAHEVSAAAHLPTAQTKACGVPEVAAAGRAVTAVRVEGPEPSVVYRCAALRTELAGFGDSAELDSEASARLWDDVRVARFVWEPAERLVWRLSVPPTSAAAVVERIRHSLYADVFYDWGGGLIWVSLHPGKDAGEEVVRGAIAHAGGGHATLVRAPAELRRAVPVFQPQSDGLAALTRRVKQNFDPAAVFGRGRMVEGV